MFCLFYYRFAIQRENVYLAANGSEEELEKELTSTYAGTIYLGANGYQLRSVFIGSHYSKINNTVH